ncbi:MAG: hypothetical protein KC910_18770, partial [Candidatus Eremiobacteraeota bacterium]|nr:hypothetical protein [Candidatus Eremiobacteraeota bacterium]
MPKKTTRGSVDELKEALEVSRIQARQLLTTAVDRKKTIGALERELGSKHQELKELENRLSMLEQRALRREASLPLLRKRERTIEKLEAKLRATQEWLSQSRARSQKLLDELRSKAERVEELEVLIHQSEGTVNRDKTAALLRREQKKLRQYKAAARRLERDLESLKASHEKAVARLSERDGRIDELERLVIGRTPEALETRLKRLEKKLETVTAERDQQTQVGELLEQELARIIKGEVPRLEELEIPSAKKASLASLADFVLEREQTVDELRFRVLEANDQMQRYRARMDQLKSRLLISQRKAEKLRRELVETARLEHAENLILAEREERIAQLENDLRQTQQDLQDQQTVTAALRTLVSQHGTALTDEPAKLVEHLRGLLESREKLV